MRVLATIALLLASAHAEAAAQPMPRERPTDEAPAASQPATPRSGAGIVHLRGLDTLNGRAQDVDVALGETTRFGHLEITADGCRAPDGDAGDVHAHLRIRDIREDRLRFAGWMFASSPALSALDHPRYDVWVLSCSNR